MGFLNYKISLFPRKGTGGSRPIFKEKVSCLYIYFYALLYLVLLWKH